MRILLSGSNVLCGYAVAQTGTDTFLANLILDVHHEFESTLNDLVARRRTRCCFHIDVCVVTIMIIYVYNGLSLESLC
jgi:hypothetical protein